jgi:hypothetical protein
MVLLIVPEGKKWSLHYLQQQIGGKKWEKMLVCVGYNMGVGDYPHATASPDIMTKPNFSV